MPPAALGTLSIDAQGRPETSTVTVFRLSLDTQAIRLDAP